MPTHDQVDPANQGAVSTPPQENGVQEIFIDYKQLRLRLPLCDRALREAIRKGLVPSIILPGARKRIFHWPSVEASFRRLQRGGNHR